MRKSTATSRRCGSASSFSFSSGITVTREIVDDLRPQPDDVEARIDDIEEGGGFEYYAGSE